VRRVDIYLVRRAQHNAALLPDELVFYLAYGRLVTATLTATFLLRVPFYVTPGPTDWIHTWTP